MITVLNIGMQFGVEVGECSVIFRRSSTYFIDCLLTNFDSSDMNQNVPNCVEVFVSILI